VGVLDQPVGKRRLTVIDVSDDAEITYLFHNLRSGPLAVS
jgi:hypothetical protein